jgi:serine/threonine-protein kinase
MGAVFRARDTKLDRDVALKILPEAFAHDADRLARFTREAKVLASLNHPHIAGIHGLEESHGITALVMELVEGEDLSQHIARGAIPLDAALPIARQIAEALEAAHEQGIIHRDLKPANIKLKARGTPRAEDHGLEPGLSAVDVADCVVKVLDFGLAKAMLPAFAQGASAGHVHASVSPTITTPAMTQAGMILGTAAYMSPEQARGRPVDRRADIWAFGCVLFEMLTGQRAFGGDDVADTIAAVVRAEPDWQRLPAALSPALNAFLRRCLQKDPRQRLGDMRDMRLALEGAFDVSTLPASNASRSGQRRVAPIAVPALVGGALIAALTTWALTRQAPPAPAHVERLVLPTPVDAPPDTVFSSPPVVAVSLDGSRVVYRSSRGGVNERGVLYVRERGQVEPMLLRGTEGAVNPILSPDGAWVAFNTRIDDSLLKRVSTKGGPTQTICALDGPLRGASWASDDTIVFATATSKGLRRVPASGGEPQVLTNVDPADRETDHLWPEVLPGGQGVVFTAWAGSPEGSRIVVMPLTTGSASYGRVSTLIEGGSQPRFARSGHLVFAVGGSLRAVAFDMNRLLTNGTPVPVLEGVRMTITGAAHYSLSATGSLVYVPGSATFSTTRQCSLAWIDRTGAPELLKVPAGPYLGPRLSPNGRWIAFGVDDGKNASIRVHDLAGDGVPRRLTLDGQGRNRFPVWSPDGERVTFQSDRENDEGIFWQRADGSGPAERLVSADEGQSAIPQSWSPDGRRLLYAAVAKDGSTSLLTWSLKDNRADPFETAVSRWSATTGVLPGAIFSPDGKWVAYSSGDGREIVPRLFVQPFPPTGAKYQLPQVGQHPVWSPDGKTLLFSPGPFTRLDSVRIVTEPVVDVGEPTPLPLGRMRTAPPWVERLYDVSRDGSRILGLIDRTETSAPPQQIHIIQNWFEELKTKVPVK